MNHARAIAVVFCVVLMSCADAKENTSCSTGEETCACYPNGTCNGQLACRSDLCVDLGTDNAAGADGAGSQEPSEKCHRAGNSGQAACEADDGCDAPFFTINNIATVTSTCCGLEWQQFDDETRHTLADAFDYCASLDLGGGGWRVPSVGELEWLADHCRVDPSIDTGPFPTTGAENYWTSTPDPTAQDSYWDVSFASAYSGKHSASEAYRVRCVR